MGEAPGGEQCCGMLAPATQSELQRLFSPALWQPCPTTSLPSPPPHVHHVVRLVLDGGGVDGHLGAEPGRSEEGGRGFS